MRVPVREKGVFLLSDNDNKMDVPVFKCFCPPTSTMTTTTKVSHTNWIGFFTPGTAAHAPAGALGLGASPRLRRALGVPRAPAPYCSGAPGKGTVMRLASHSTVPEEKRAAEAMPLPQ